MPTNLRRDHESRRVKFQLGTMKDYVRQREEFAKNPGLVNAKAHDVLHAPRIIVYNSPATLTTTTGPKINFPSGGEITHVRATVEGAPTSTFELDYLIDGISVWQSGTYLTIPNGETVSKNKLVERPAFSSDSNHKFKINTVAAATGPMIVTIEYMPEF